MGLASFAGSVVLTVAGLVSLNIFVLGAASYGAFFRTVDEKKKKARLDARSDLWDLSKHPLGLPEFHHRLHVTDEGVNLHFVEGGSTSPESPLIVFIHGFPDSWYIWHHQLSSRALQQSAHLIAVDLPGFGASDSFSNASASAVLGALTSFILAKQSGRPTILVTHDWGGVIGARLASEVGVLFARCIILNAIHPAIATANIRRATASASRMLSNYIRNPFNIPLLLSAFRALKPALTQTKCSYYVSVFLLPAPLARQLLKMGDMWFLRMLAKLARVRNEELYLASALGPSRSEADGYPPSILERQDINKRVDGMISYYRGSLAFGKWRQSEDIQRLVMAADRSAGRTSTGSDDQGPAGRFQCPVTIVYGGRDTAFHRPFCYDNLSDFFMPSTSSGVQSSFLLCFPKAAHWTMVSSPGRESVEALIRCAIGDAGPDTWKAELGSVDANVVFEIES